MPRDWSTPSAWTTPSSAHRSRPGPDRTTEVGVARTAATIRGTIGTRPQAKGRYIVSGHDTDFLEMAGILRRESGEGWPLPKRILPKWLLWLVGPFVNKTMTRKWVSRNIGLPARFDNSKSRNELGLTYRPLEESICEMFQQMIEDGELSER